MTPKPQAKTIDEILFCTTGCGSNADPADGFGYCTCGNEQTTQDIEALITEARANERQAMLDAVPKKIKYTGDEIMGMKIAISEQQVADGFTFRGTKEIDAFNQAIDQMEAAIKLIGGEK